MSSDQVDLYHQSPVTVPIILPHSRSLYMLNPIPGTKKSLSDCGHGVWSRKVICKTDPDHVKKRYVGGRHCGDPECEVCWSSWASRAADRIACRMEGFTNLQNPRYRPRHIIVSLDDNEILQIEKKSADPYDLVERFKKKILAKAALVGVIGGALILHLYRTDDSVPSWIEGQKRWEWVRDQGPGWSGHCRVRPHGHIVAFGWLSGFDEDTFSYKNAGSLASREAIMSVAYYALSHCGIMKNNVFYFGQCNSKKLVCTWQALVSKEMRCPACGDFMIYEETKDWLVPWVVMGKTMMAGYQLKSSNIEPGG